MNTNDIVSCFERCVQEHAQHIAVRYEDKEMTYAGLDQCAGRLAAHIRLSSPLNEKADPVALLMNHDGDMIAGLLGTLKAGKTYVALDPLHPEERLLNILRDCRPRYLVAAPDHLGLAYQLMYLSGLEMEIIDYQGLVGAVSPDRVEIAPDREAYILYTSGSTGTPKGIFQSHRNILGMLNDLTNEIDIRPEDRILLTTPYTHTVAAIDIFSALLNGASLDLLDLRKDPGAAFVSAYIRDREITILHTVPSLFRHVFGKEGDVCPMPSVRLLLLGGEDVYRTDFELYHRHFSDHCYFINLFGSSEILVCSMLILDKSSMPERNIIPIGYPLIVADCRIVDEEGKEASVLMEGELVVRSEFITSGYHNRPDLNRKHFDIGGAFHTGDLVRSLPDGSLEYAGRKDLQVKLNGNRADLREIECLLNRYQSIGQSAVTCRRSDSSLTACYTDKPGMHTDAREVKEYLRKYLPEYMIPAHFMAIDKMPLTPSGKLDRGNLPEWTEQRTHRTTEELSDTERSLLAVWSETFRGARIDVYDNFFQLGGNSLIATELVNRIFLELGCELELESIFDHQSIAELARLIETSRKPVC